MSEVMEQALDIALDKKDLKRKRARRLDRKSRTGEKTCPGKVSAKSRYIPSGLTRRSRRRTRISILSRSL